MTTADVSAAAAAAEAEREATDNSDAGTTAA